VSGGLGVKNSQHAI